MIASESVACTSLDFELARDVLPGEAVIVTHDGALESKVCCASTTLTPCIFEFVYFARPDSIIDTISVHKARCRMGQALGRQILSKLSLLDIDVVVCIPDSGRTAALELAREIGVPYEEGFVKNKYIQRTFIMPTNRARVASIRKKLNPIAHVFKNKSVLIVDDSIVRGNTVREAIRLARRENAKKVFFASAAPPIRYPNVYGIDLPSPTEYVAYNRTIAQIREHLGLDGLFYQRLDDLIGACIEPESTTNFECSCFTNRYIT